MRDRVTERDALDRLADKVRSGQSQALVLRGDPGVGKTALLDYLAERAAAAGGRVARVSGVQSEMELAFAGLHQLCAPMLERAPSLPGPQRGALLTAFGLAPGPPPDRFYLALAVLSLLAAEAAERPLFCLVDDEQWLDRGSAQALGFAARQLAADPVALVFSTRETGPELARLPEVLVTGLTAEDAGALLDESLTVPLDAKVREQIIAESRGNPLALLELPRGLTPLELAGGFGLPGASALTGRIEASFARQVDALPAPTRRLLLLAAADPSGDPPLLWRAAGRLGLAVEAAEPAEEAGLVEFDVRVRFSHPLARSAAYRSASLADRRNAHAALAEVTDPDADPDRRAWHRAQAAAGPDEEVAAELERSAGRARARGGTAAGGAFLQRAVALTVDPARRAERALAAAQASFEAGAFDAALTLAATAEDGPLDPPQSARAALLRALVAFSSGLGGDAPPLLLSAARRLEPFDRDLARETYLTAWGAAGISGPAAAGPVFLEICRDIRALPPSADPRLLDLVLDSLAVQVTDGHAAAGPTIRQIAADLTRLPVEDVLRWGWMAVTVAAARWDFEELQAISERQVRLVREAGALAHLPLYLAQLGIALPWVGDFAGAAAVVAESESVAAAIGSPIGPYTLMRLQALQGREAEAAASIAIGLELAAAGQGIAAAYAHWAAAILGNGLGRYDMAASAAQQAVAESLVPYQACWALPELVEAAAHGGHRELATEAFAQLAESTQAAGTDVAAGVEARCRALLDDGAAAEGWYLEAIDRLGRTRVRPELARAHLLYGEWLRRRGRRADARGPLRAAYEQLSRIGMDAFAERARRELIATGETVRRRSVAPVTALTAQEALIARLAADGLTNPEIGARLFLSARTVEWHLRKIFAKLGIGSRRELPAALAQRGQDG